MAYADTFLFIRVNYSTLKKCLFLRKIEDITKFSARAEKKKIHLNNYVRIDLSFLFLLDFLLVGFLEQLGFFHV